MFSQSFARRGFGMAVAALSAAVAFVAGGCVSAVKDEQVVQKAQEAHTKVEVAVLGDKDVDAYLDQVGDRLKQAARELDANKELGNRGLMGAGDRAWMFGDEVQFRLVNNQKSNAVSTGGNFIYVYNGFLQEAETEAELAALLAHEFGHIYCRHVHNQETGRIQRETYMKMAQENIAAEPDPEKRQALERGYAAMYNLGSQLGHLGFSNKDEAEADEVGFLTYCKAGYPPETFDVLFRNRLNRGGDTGYVAAESDHPSLKKRIENVARYRKKYAERLALWQAQDPVVPQFKFDDVKRRAADAAAKVVQTPAFAAAQETLNAFPSCFTDKEKAGGAAAPPGGLWQPGQSTPAP